MPSRPHTLSPASRTRDRHSDERRQRLAGKPDARSLERQRHLTLDEKLDEALKQTFPASDPFVLV